MGSIIDNLNAQFETTKKLISTKTTDISTTQNLVNMWSGEMSRLWKRYNDLGSLASKEKKAEYLASYTDAYNRRQGYKLTLATRKADLVILQKQLIDIQNNIDDYYEAIEESLGKGIPEEGSIEIAEAYVQAELDRVQADLDAQTNNESGKTLNRKIFVAIGVVLGLLVIWYVFKKIKKGKKK